MSEGGISERSDLTDREQRVIRLIDAGYTRWRIAEFEAIDERNELRPLIASLCERYNCRMNELPDAADGDY